MNEQEKAPEHIYGSINFPAIPDVNIDFPVPESVYNFAERIKQMLEPIEQSVANMTKDIYPSMIKALEEYQNSLLEIVKPTIQHFNQSYKLYDWSALTDSIFSSINIKLEQYDWSSLLQRLTPVLDSIKSSSQSISIDFSEDDLETIEQLKIPLDEYATTSPNKPTRKIFTISDIIAVISLLVTLITIIDAKISDIQTSKEITKIQNQLDELKSTNQQTNEEIAETQEELDELNSTAYRIENLLAKMYDEMIEE